MKRLVAFALAGALAHGPALALGPHSDLVVGESVPARSFKVAPKFMTWSGARWASSVLTWYYHPAGSPLPEASVVATAQAAFAKWSAACNVGFVYGGLAATPVPASDGRLVIGWGDMAGESSAIARIDIVGETILDADIVLNPRYAGISVPLDAVLLHEAGHALGLNHSNVAYVAMSGPPFTPYADYQTMRTLHPDDIAGCQALYGPAPGVVATNPPPAPACTVQVATATPALGTRLVVAAQCSGMPYEYRWTGCSEPGGRYCFDTATAAGVRTYGVVAVNAGGSSAPAQASATWIEAVPSCRVMQESPTGPPAAGQRLTLYAQCSNAASRYRWTNCASAGSTCSVVHPLGERVTYTVVAENVVGASVPASIAVEWTGDARSTCGGFADVDGSTPFCASVEWMANRTITRGCAPGVYCGTQPVSRVQMAQFMARLGDALTPVVVRAGAASMTMATDAIACQTEDLAATPFARSAIVRARFTGRPAEGSAVLHARLLSSSDGGQGWSHLSVTPGAGEAFGKTGSATLNDVAVAHIPPGRSVRFGLAIAGPKGMNVLGTCTLFAEVLDRSRGESPL